MESAAAASAAAACCMLHACCYTDIYLRMFLWLHERSQLASYLQPSAWAHNITIVYVLSACVCYIVVWLALLVVIPWCVVSVVI